MRIKYLLHLSLAIIVALSSLFCMATPKSSAAPAGAGNQTSSITVQALSDISNATSLAQLATADNNFLSQYNMNVSFTCPTLAQSEGDICTDTTSSQFTNAQTTSNEVVSELSKLPTVLLAGFAQHTYYIVSDFKLNVGTSTPVEVGGLFDSNFNGPLIKDSTARETILHEFFHFFQYYKVGSNYAADPTWSSYNPVGFSYDTNNPCVDGEANCVGGTHPEDGFVTGYAETNIAEDKAETFAYLFESMSYQKLETWIQTDSLLAGKVAAMKAFLASIDPSMNDAYYTAIHAYALANYDYDGYVDGFQQVTGDESSSTFDVSDDQTLEVDGIAGGTIVEIGGILDGNGSITGGLIVAGTIAPGHSPGCLTTDTLELSGIYQAQIGGDTACTGYDQIKATSSVDLTPTVKGGGSQAATLETSLYGGFVPSVGDKYTIIDNQSSSPVTGTFDGLAEGATFTSQGVTYSISYVGGDGNDVVLTVLKVDLAAAAAASSTPTITPKTPDTGIGLFMTDAELPLLGTGIMASGIYIISRKVSRPVSKNS